jgi:two-component system sensor histidine kinase AlgZ
LLLVLSGALAALLFALIRTSAPDTFWIHFGVSLLFIQWVLLLSAAVVCSLSKLIAFWSAARLGGLILTVTPLVCLFTSMVSTAIVPLAADQALWWFVTRNVLICVIASIGFSRYLVLHERWQREVLAEAGARLDALQARIRPHFLFNALNTISSLIHEKPDLAEAATLDLADLLRTGISGEGQHALAIELEVIQRYLRIEGLRLGDRLSVEWDCQDLLLSDQPIPPLLLQPLVENAIIHGISRRAKGGTVRIEGKRIRFGRIRFTVTNPLADSDSRPADGNRSALENIRQRLALAYEERYGLKTRIEEGHFIAELTIPIED